jgi:hypothetical protein
MTGNQGETIAMALDSFIEHLPNRFLPQRLIRPTRVAKHRDAPRPPGILAQFRKFCSVCVMRRMGAPREKIGIPNPER